MAAKALKAFWIVTTTIASSSLPEFSKFRYAWRELEDTKHERMTYPVEVILLFDLPLNLTLNRQPDDEGVLFSYHRPGIRIHRCQRVLKSSHHLPRGLLLLLHRVSEIPRQRFDLLDLLAQIHPQFAQ